MVKLTVSPYSSSPERWMAARARAGVRTWGKLTSVIRSLPIAAVTGLAAAAERFFALSLSPR
jgi:hypothetical protein